ncbi:hypothetical protein BU17DRAFT_82944 [Hysterangium stoloniferum]|nr:hypothetical protein BU17DRAFT_82944 [Hysterangium stoloniferum]
MILRELSQLAFKLSISDSIAYYISTSASVPSSDSYDTLVEDFLQGRRHALTSVMYLVNILIAKYGGNSPFQVLGETWLAPVVSISAGRLVLNLRGSVTSSDTNDNDEESTEMDAWTGRDERVG